MTGSGNWLHRAFHEPQTRTGRVVEGFVWAMVLFSVAIFAAELALERSLPTWLGTLDRVVLGVFAAEYFFRVLSYHPPELELLNYPPMGRLRQHFLGRLRFMLRPMSLVDLITVAALIPALRGLRALRLLRLLRHGRFFRYADPLSGIARAFSDNGLLFSFAFTLLGIATLLGGLSLYLVEGGTNPHLATLGDGIWWALVTLTTVGFGDIAPTTTMGRLVGGVLMICGLFTLALFAGIIGHTLLRAVLSIREEQFRMSKFVDHVVVCGYDPGARLLLDRLPQELDLGEVDVVLFAREDRPQDIPPAYSWIVGDPTKDSELDKAHLAYARAVIVVGSRRRSPQEADAVTILTIFTIRAWLRDQEKVAPRHVPVFLTAEILDAENVQHALDAGADEVIETTRLGFALLSHSVISPGSAAVMSRVAEAGTHSLYVGGWPEGLVGPLPFGELSAAVRAATDSLVMGVHVAADKSDRLSPPDDYEVLAADRIIYLAEDAVLPKA